jgi:hypothetical protein
MKVLGNTPEGDLIIQVSQAEWDGLRDGKKPQEDWQVKDEQWQKTEAAQLLTRTNGLTLGGLTFTRAFHAGKIDGSIQSLRDVINGKIRISNLRPGTVTVLKCLLDELDQ